MQRVFFKFRFLTVSLILLIALNVSARQQVDILVIDSVTTEPIPYAAILVQGTGTGTLTDEAGRGSVSLSTGNAVINVTMMGYLTGTVDLTDTGASVTVRLKPVGVSLAEVTVKKRKDHYSKRNNKAVQLMERVREEAARTDPNVKDYYSYNKYEKITLALNKYGIKTDSTSTRNGQFDFLQEYVDTSEVSGNPILNISVKEKISTVYNRANPRSVKEVINATRNIGIDQIVDQGSVQTFLNDVLREINLFDNDINILQSRFVGPFSKIGADFYKYYITDTIGDSVDRMVELTFVPRTAASFGFTGKLYIATGDSSYMVRRAVMNVPHEINLNFVEHLYITQNYVKAPDGSRFKTLDDMTVELSLISGTQGLHVRRHTVLDSHSVSRPPDDAIFKYRGEVMTSPLASRHSDTYWIENRPTPITGKEGRVGEMIDRLRTRPLYYWSEKILKVLVNGYIATSANDSKFDFGPVNTVVSSNDIEGVRFRIGGMTTANLNRRLSSRGYVAYGTRDQKLKYRAELDYSFIDKEYHSREFPIHSLRLTHLYDVDMIGQHYMFTNADNVFLAWKRMKNRLMTYHRVTELTYTREMLNNLTISATIRHERQEATPYVPFVTEGGIIHPYYDESALKLSIRYAPGEKFFQTKTYRIPVNLDAPVFLLEHTYGPAQIPGNNFAINKTEASIQKRFWLSAFGYLDCLVKGGHVWSSSPYPSLLLPNANLSYTIQSESFALMNPLEFISDSYFSWDVTYWANGAILNYIPVLKRLKLREVFACRGYLGTLSEKNTPSISNSLYRFPDLALATPMHETPYTELSVGIDNLFKCLRVDYVWRATYRNTPGVDRDGIRIAFHMTF